MIDVIRIFNIAAFASVTKAAVNNKVIIKNFKNKLKFLLKTKIVIMPTAEP